MRKFTDLSHEEMDFILKPVAPVSMRRCYHRDAVGDVFEKPEVVPDPPITGFKAISDVTTRPPRTHCPVGHASHEPRAEHHIGLSMEKRFQKQRVFLRIVFKVGVLNDDNIAYRGGNTGTKSHPFSLIAFVIDDFVHKWRDLACQNIASPVL